MALNGRAGQRFSHAPQPIQRSTLITGIFGESLSSGILGTICMAPVGQWRAQLPHCTPSVSGMQFFFTHTACPIWTDDLSAFMGHRTKRVFQWSGKMGERFWKPKGLGMIGKMGWIFRSGFSLYMGLHLLYVWGAFLRIFGGLLYIGLADGAKTAWKGFIFGCVAVLWLGWWILLYDGVNGCVAVFLCLFLNIVP